MVTNSSTEFRVKNGNTFRLLLQSPCHRKNFAQNYIIKVTCSEINSEQRVETTPTTELYSSCCLLRLKNQTLAGY